MSWKTSSRIELFFSFSSSSSPLSVSLYLYLCLSPSVPSNCASKPSTVLVSQSSTSPSQSTVLFSNTATVCTRTKLAAIIKRYLGGRRNSQTDIFLDMIIKTPATQLMQSNSSQKHKMNPNLNQSINHEVAHLCSHCNFQQVHNKN
jgi:esterase/lipase superfamily enzyme